MTPRRWVLLSLGLATLASGALLVLPSYSGASAVVTSGGVETTASFRATLLEVNGAGVLGILAFPIVLSLAALLPWPGSVRTPVVAIGAVLLCGFAVLGAMSIGLFFLPSAVAMCFALGRSLHAR